MYVYHGKTVVVRPHNAEDTDALRDWLEAQLRKYTAETGVGWNLWISVKDDEILD